MLRLHFCVLLLFFALMFSTPIYLQFPCPFFHVLLFYQAELDYRAVEGKVC
jgi:hypothetical protein